MPPRRPAVLPTHAVRTCKGSLQPRTSAVLSDLSSVRALLLLDRKLLPDLDYGEDTAIQLVLNGAYNMPRSQLALSDWV